MKFKEYFLIKEDPDSANFRIGEKNYYATFHNVGQAPITFLVYNKELIVYAYTEQFYHNDLRRDFLLRLFKPEEYYSKYEIENLSEDVNSFSVIKKDLEKINIKLIGELNEQTKKFIKNCHYVDETIAGHIFYYSGDYSQNYLSGRMFMLSIEEFYKEGDIPIVPCFSFWNDLKYLDSKNAKLLLQLPEKFNLDSNLSLLERPGLESIFLKSLIK